jgi:hypothetical protein
MDSTDRNRNTDRSSRRNMVLGVMAVLAVAIVGYIAFVVFFAAENPGRLPNPADTIEGAPATEREGVSDGGSSPTAPQQSAPSDLEGIPPAD